jgi:hypothetical protein
MSVRSASSLRRALICGTLAWMLQIKARLKDARVLMKDLVSTANHVPPAAPAAAAAATLRPPPGLARQAARAYNPMAAQQAPPAASQAYLPYMPQQQQLGLPGGAAPAPYQPPSHFLPAMMQPSAAATSMQARASSVGWQAPAMPQGYDNAAAQSAAAVRAASGSAEAEEHECMVCMDAAPTASESLLAAELYYYIGPARVPLRALLTLRRPPPAAPSLSQSARRAATPSAAPPARAA